LPLGGVVLLAGRKRLVTDLERALASG
jgi:hypothetical protein